MAPPTLVSLCMKTGIKNINFLTDVGDFEYWKIKPLLKHVKSPEQLREIELNSPQIKGEDAELWKIFIAKVDPKWHLKNYVPKNPQKWYEIYRKYKREAEEKLKQDEENLRNAMLGLHKDRAAHTSVVVDAKNLPRLPRDPRMRPNNGGVPLGKNGKGQGRTRNESVLTWGTGSKTKTSDSKSVLLRAKREAKEMSMRGRLGVPANQLKSRSVIKQAPPSMVDGYRRAANAPLKIYTPKSGTLVTAGRSNTDTAQEAGERRLRALTMGRNEGVQQSGIARQRNVEDDDASSEDRIGRNAPTGMAKPNVVSDDEDSDMADLFDEKPSLPKKSASQSPAIKSKESTIPSHQKPSNLISSLLASSKKTNSPSSSSPKAREIVKPTPSSASPAAATKSVNPMARSINPGQNRSGSPAVPPAAKPVVRKRAPVDVFNRQAKKPRRL